MIRAEFVTLAIDGWTNVRHSKMLNFVVIAKKLPYFIDSVRSTTTTFILLLIALEL